MHALIFDIDGTLLDSTDVDTRLYVAAVRHILGSVQLRKDWNDYEHVTDIGILNGILADNGISGDHHTVRSIQQRFVDSLQSHIETNGPFVEMPGARQFVAAALAATDYSCAYATGGWSASASLKLKSAGFPTEDVPLASSDDAADRCGIMLQALEALGGAFETITYFGDGVWDRDATRRLGWNFVPVGKRLNGLAQYPIPPADSGDLRATGG
jgi:phosphoglycolate phosphatase-like HAD superfamily hydrolase